MRNYQLVLFTIAVGLTSNPAMADPSQKLATSSPVVPVLDTPIFAAAELDKLEAGEILILVSKSTLGDHKAAYIQSGVLIEATPQEIWPIFTDCARAPSYVKGLVSCEILKQAQDKSWDVRRHVNKPAALLPKMKSDFEQAIPIQAKSRFTALAGILRAMWDGGI